MNIEDIEKYSQKKINKILFDYEVKKNNWFNNLQLSKVMSIKVAKVRRIMIAYKDKNTSKQTVLIRII